MRLAGRRRRRLGASSARGGWRDIQIARGPAVEIDPVLSSDPQRTPLSSSVLSMDGTENPLAHALEQQQQLWRDCFYFLFGEVEKRKTLCQMHGGG